MQFLSERRVLVKILWIQFRVCARAYTEAGSVEPRSLLFFGNDDFALESLRKLHDKHKSGALSRLSVVTSGRRLGNPVAEYAETNQLPWESWPLKSDIFGYQVGVVVSFGHLIPSKLINAFPLGILNVHASLLPRWRGPAPISHCLFNGDTKTGVTIMKIQPAKFDIGEILVQKETVIGPEETNLDLRPRLARMGAELLAETLEKLPEALQRAWRQDESLVTYAPKLGPRSGLIDWNKMTAEEVWNRYRGLHGLVVLSTKFRNQTVKLLDVQLVKDSPFTAKHQDKPPGSVIWEKLDRRLLVKCQDHRWVSVKRLIFPNRQPIQAVDFRSAYLNKGTNSVLLQ